MTTLSWPSSGGTAGSNPSVSPTGQSIPSEATLVGGENPSGDLTPLQQTADGALIISPDPTTIGNVNISEYGGTATTLGQKASAASIPVVIASDQSAVPVSSTTLATAALQTTGNTSLASILANQTNGTQVTQLVAGTATIGTVSIDQTTPGTTNGVVLNAGTSSIGSLLNITGTISLPTGAATAALQTSTQGSVQSGTAATTATLIAGTFNPSLVNLTSGQQAGLQMDTFANTKVTMTAAQSSVTTEAGTPNPGTLHQTAITVGTTAVRLTVSGSAPSSTRSVLVATPDSATATTVVFYIGSSSVTNSGSTRGVEIQVGQSFIANDDAGDYFIVASIAAQTVALMEQF